MPKLRKMLGNINSPECVALMALIETQNKICLATWAVDYAKTNYLSIYQAQYPNDLRLRDAIIACEDYLKGKIKMESLKPIIKEATQNARELAHNPIAQAAARAIATACATIHTPTSALGFLFYGAASTAYTQVGMAEKAEVYDDLASAELKKAFVSLQQIAVPNEPCPAKIKWNC